MLKPFRRLAKFSSSSKGSKMVLLTWIIIAVLFSFLFPSAKDYSGNSTEGTIKENTASEIASRVLEEEFPSDDGLTALLVFHQEEGINEHNQSKVTELSEWFASDDKPKGIATALPYHQFPENVQNQMYSEDETTLIFNLALQEGLDSDEANDTLNAIRDKVNDSHFENMQFEITGPAGISADTVNLFQNADLTLMMATIGLIFMILIVIYRSPLLAITPLLIAGIVYAVVDRLLGLAGQNGLFSVDSSAVSIMLVLLFAVLTDYSLFVFSRYREELMKKESKYDSMSEAIHHVSEPIFFSGGTVLLAMLALFTTIFEPYNHFAPVFSMAIVVILIAGLTLIPSIFALMGRKAFWPFIPEVGKQTISKKKFWYKVTQSIAKYPKWIASSLLIVLLIGVFNLSTMNFSFNLMGSFPEDISSRQGFDLLAEHYPPGQLAPVDVVLKSDHKIDTNKEFLEKVMDLRQDLTFEEGIKSVSPEFSEEVINGEEDLPRDFLAETEKSIKLQVTLDSNPYDVEALNTIERVRNKSGDFLRGARFASNDYQLHYAGQTADQVDVKLTNKRDMIVLFSLVTILLTIILAIQTRSILMSLLMMGTILLSYAASLGFGWFIFKNIMGFDAISYRLPVYTFIFMVALGIDYSIILVSRIREKAKKLPWEEAVKEGVSLTGGVISSAGLILAATFAVLMTQPLQELFLFGFTMALGILLTTFLVAVVFLPTILFMIPKFRNNK